MPETSVPVASDTAGTLNQVDGFSLPDGKVQQAVVIGDGTTQGRIVGVTADGRLQVKLDTSGTEAVTSVAPSTTSVQLLAADTTGGRLGVILFNDTAQIAYVRLGATAAAITSTAPAGAFSFEIAPGQPWESPRNFVGAIQCIWASTSGGGAMRVTTF